MKTTSDVTIRRKMWIKKEFNEKDDMEEEQNKDIYGNHEFETKN